jgi:acyl-CoA synthetase (AMP-forming)/AMP-acid ligase II
VTCGDREVSYHELEERTNRLAHYLASIGVTEGDHVGLYSGNSVEALETLLACCKLRAVAININYRYGDKELAYLLADSDSVAVVYQRRLGPVVAAAAGTLPGLRPGGLVVIDDETTESPGDTGGGPAGAVPYEAALAQGSPERQFAPRSADDTYIIYTGGTTGNPKGVMWRHEDIWRTLGGGIDFYTREPLPDEWAQSEAGKNGALVRLAAAPLIHGNAQIAVLQSLFAGETVVLLPRFDAHDVWRQVERRKINVMVIIGDAMARPLVDALKEGKPDGTPYDTSSVIVLNSSAALFTPAVKDTVVDALPNALILEAVGSTETGFAGLGTVTKGGGSGSGPKVTNGRDVIVIDESGRPLGPGGVGLLARGGNVPVGYYKDPEKTAKLFTEVDGKRYTVPGDWARVEEDGSFTLLGRGNTCVNTGGEKVYPEEVEGALKSHADVFDALVLGVPDERLGQAVAAIVQPRPGAELDLDALDAHVRGELAGYKAPRSVWVVDEIGRTVSGKSDFKWAKSHTETVPPARGHAPTSQPA